MTIDQRSQNAVNVPLVGLLAIVLIFFLFIFLTALTENAALAFGLSLVITISQLDKLSFSTSSSAGNRRSVSQKTSKLLINAQTCLYCNHAIKIDDTICLNCSRDIRVEKLGAVETITQPAGHYKHQELYDKDGTEICSANCINKKSKDWKYTVLTVFPKAFKSDVEGKLTISGLFRQDDTFTKKLEKGRRYLRVYVLDAEQNKILESEEVLNHKDKLDWHFRKITIDHLKPTTSYLVGIGRRQAWQHNWHIQYEFSQIRISSYEKD